MKKIYIYLLILVGCMAYSTDAFAQWEQNAGAVESIVEDGYYRIKNDRHGNGAANDGVGYVTYTDAGVASSTYASFNALSMKDSTQVTENDWNTVWHIWKDGKGYYHLKNCGDQEDTYICPQFTSAGLSSYQWLIGTESDLYSKVKFYTKSWGSSADNDQNSVQDKLTSARTGYLFIHPKCSTWRWRIGSNNLVGLNGYTGSNPQGQWILESVDITGKESWLLLKEAITDVLGEHYTLGENPGEVSSSTALAALNKVLDEATILRDNGASDEDNYAAIKALKEANAAVKQTVVPLTPGYYVFYNRINPCALVPYNDRQVRETSTATSFYQPGTTATYKAAAKSWHDGVWWLGWEKTNDGIEVISPEYVWHLTAASDSTFYMKSCAEDSFNGDSTYFDPILKSKSILEDAKGNSGMCGTARSAVQFEKFESNLFDIKNERNWFHICQGDNHLVTHNPNYTHMFASWKIAKVPDSRITAKWKLNEAITDAAGIIVDWNPGTNPGQLKMSIAQPVIDAVEEARAIYKQSLSDAEYIAAEQKLRDVFNNAKVQLLDTVNAQVPVEDGYYRFRNPSYRFQYDTGNPDNIPTWYGDADGRLHWDTDYPSALTDPNHAFYVKKLESGNFSIRCAGTGQYVGPADSLEIVPMLDEPDPDNELIITTNPKGRKYKSDYKRYHLDMFNTRGWVNVSNTGAPGMSYQLKNHDNGSGVEGLVQPLNWLGACYYVMERITDQEYIKQLDEMADMKSMVVKLNSTVKEAKDVIAITKTYKADETQPLLSNATFGDPECQISTNAQQIGSSGALGQHLLDDDWSTYFLSRTSTTYGPYISDYPYLQVDLREPQSCLLFKVGVYGSGNVLYGNDSRRRPITYGASDAGHRRRPTLVTIEATNDTLGVWNEIGTYSWCSHPDIRTFYTPAVDMGTDYRFIRIICKDNGGHSLWRGLPMYEYSQLQIFPATYDAANSSCEYDEAVKLAVKNLNDLLPSAQAQLKEDKTSSAFITELQDAVAALKAVAVDSTNLESRIMASMALLDSCYVVDDVDKQEYGDVTKAQKDLLEAAVKNAKDAMAITNHPTAASLAAAYATLDEAYWKLNSERKMFETNKWYHIQSTAKQSYHVSDNPEWRGMHVIYASGNNAQAPLVEGQMAAKVEPLRWGHYVDFADYTGLGYPVNLGATKDYGGGYLDCETNPYTMWRIVELGDSVYALQNRATGYYMGRTLDGQKGVSLSTTPVKCKINIVGRGQFEIVNIENEYYASKDDAASGTKTCVELPLHSDAADFRAVWDGEELERGFQTASSYTFTPIADPEDVIDYHAYDNNIQIMTLPIDVDFSDGILSSAIEDPKAYGISNIVVDKDNEKTTLSLVEKTVIKAGEPFILYTGDPESYTGSVDDSIQIFVDPTDDFTQVASTDNGLVGVLNGESLSQKGMGFFAKGVLQAVGEKAVTIQGMTGYIDASKVTDLGVAADLVYEANVVLGGGALIGDVTGDGVINVGDLTALITMVMNDYADKDDKFTAGDMNADGILNVGDITSLVSMIMSASAKAQDAADEIEAADANTLYVPAISNAKANSTDAIMSVEMVNADPISAFQFDLETPAGISVAVEDDFLAVELSTARTTAKKHVVESQAQKDGSVRVLLYSNKNYDFSGNTGEVCTIGLAIGAVADGVYDCTLKNIALSTATSVVFTPANVKAQVGVGVSVGINDAKVNAENGTYYNLKGQKVNAAQKGVNIVKYNDKAIKVVK